MIRWSTDGIGKCFIGRSIALMLYDLMNKMPLAESDSLICIPVDLNPALCP